MYDMNNKSSAVAEMAVQCCTTRISVLSGIALFNTVFVSILVEYYLKSYTAENQILLATFLMQITNMT